MFNPQSSSSSVSKQKPFVLAKNAGPSQRLYSVFMYLHSHIQNVNSSKMFAGIMIITLNIASKFTTIKLSKTMESYLKFSFSRDALIFAIAWVGSRDIYTAIMITFFFVVCMDFLFNEESAYCVFPGSFKERHINMLDSGGATSDEPVTPDEIKRAKDVLTRAGKQTQLALDYDPISQNKVEPM